MCAYIYSKKYILFKNCNLYACGGALQYFIAFLKSGGKSNVHADIYSFYDGEKYGRHPIQ